MSVTFETPLHLDLSPHLCDTPQEVSDFEKTNFDDISFIDNYDKLPHNDGFVHQLCFFFMLIYTTIPVKVMADDFKRNVAFHFLLILDEEIFYMIINLYNCTTGFNFTSHLNFIYFKFHKEILQRNSR